MARIALLLISEEAPLCTMAARAFAKAWMAAWPALRNSLRRASAAAATAVGAEGALALAAEEAAPRLLAPGMVSSIASALQKRW
jgi:hypothetical protein